MTRPRAPWLYRVLLCVLPRRLRERHGPDIEEAFLEAWHSAGKGRSRVRVAWLACSDVLRTAVRWRLGGRRRAPGAGAPGSPHRTGGGGGVDRVWQDLRFAARSLRLRPGFTAVAVVTLALGIGANTTIFSVVNGVLLAPLPYDDADRLAIIWNDLGNGAQSLPAVNQLDYLDYREWSETFEDFTLASGRRLILGAGDDPELVDVGMVAANFFPFFGVETAVGRHISEAEDQPAGPRTMVLSYRVWERRYGADPAVLGRVVEVAGVPHEVVGVLPADFRLHLPAEAFLLRDADVWVPAQVDPAAAPPRNFTGWTVFGRVHPGVTFDEAQHDMETIEARLKEIHPVHAASNLQIRVVPFHHDVVKRARAALWVLMTAVGFVLLIACANVANLLLARGHGRRRELSVRAALGSSRGGLARLVFLESVLLAGAGALLGTLLSNWGLMLLTRFGRSSIPRLDEVSIDGTALAFASLSCVLAAVLFGLVPSVQAGRQNLAGSLSEGARSGESRRQGRVRRFFILGEVALSVMLLIGAGLMIRSFASLQQVRPGFEPAGLLTLQLSLPQAEYGDFGERRAFQQELVERLGALPGVESVSATSQLPLTGSGPLQPFAYDEASAQNWESVTADERWVLPGYFETIGATLLEGRDFSSDEFDPANPKIIIDETLAARAFPGRSAVGEQLQVQPTGSPNPYATVIGVVAHINLHDVGSPFLPQIYGGFVGQRQFSVVLRTSVEPESLASLAESRVKDMNPSIPVQDVRPMTSLVSEALAQARLSLVLMSAFGAMALVLASVGIYGVVSFAVSQRTHEFGIRMALGEAPERIRRGVLGDGLRLVVVSVGLGLLGAVAVSRFVASLLYGVDPLDPLTYAVVASVLGAVAALASWLPARRATRVDPMGALRAE